MILTCRGCISRDVQMVVPDSRLAERGPGGGGAALRRGVACAASSSEAVLERQLEGRVVAPSTMFSSTRYRAEHRRVEAAELAARSSSRDFASSGGGASSGTTR